MSDTSESSGSAKSVLVRKKLGIIGGSGLIQSKAFSSSLEKNIISTDDGEVMCYSGKWNPSSSQNEEDELDILFIQRHHATPDDEYHQPRQINYRAIAQALKIGGCDAVLGVYSVGSMSTDISMGRLVVPDDYFNPFSIMHISQEHEAHVVPGMSTELRNTILSALKDGNFHPHDGGVYVQTSGPRFETKAEVRFFSHFGELVGMTGANEAELMNELHIPFAMLGLVDNMANGICHTLTMEEFKQAQKANVNLIESAVCHTLSSLAEVGVLDRVLQRE